VSRLSRKDAKKPPGTFDDFLLLSTRCCGLRFRLGIVGMVMMMSRLRRPSRVRVVRRAHRY
jgi:hypothetical protein